MASFNRKKYLLATLLIILAFNCVEGLALGLVLPDIKRDLALTDTELGLLSGIAIALSYSVMGIPIARWADRGDRVTIISLTTLVWAIMLTLSGCAASFAQLLLIRVGVGIGETGLVPPAHSLIADHFTRAERPRAMATYLQGNTLGILLGYFVAGWLNQWYGWRVTFVALGLAGLVPPLVARLTLRDPRFGEWSSSAVHSAAPVLGEGPETDPITHPTLKEVCFRLWTNTTFRHLLFGFSVVCFFGNGISQWQPSFLARAYGMNTGALGAWLTLIYGVGGMLGMYLGGIWAARYAQNNERLQLKVMAALYCVSGLVSLLIYVSPNQYWAFVWMAVSTVVGSLTSGPLFATIQTLIPAHMRAMAIAIVYFFANLIGLGLGPLAVGALSDALRPVAHDDSLRCALLMVSPGLLWVAWHLSRASACVTRDLAAVSEEVSHEQGSPAASTQIAYKG